MSIVLIILPSLFLLALFLQLIFFFRKRKNSKELRVVQNVEDGEYNDIAETYETEEKEEDDTDGNDIRDIYNKITPKKKTAGYQTKTYRGPDVEITGAESKKDAKDLKRSSEIDGNIEEVVKVEIAKELTQKPSQPKPEDLNRKKSGIEGNEGAMSKIMLELTENYLVKGEVSATDNFSHSVKKMLKAEHHKHHHDHHDHHADKKKGGGGMER